ncbi:hypothetical protein UFOVP156_24 [uncultured Caudovirales phage]|uniref:Uncharacterized protein n=1 Tax=uncultured Caudovirales phage TaxID=2100421 RepID=A0A6J7W944_9CAUD|nr:hypothetical protein UFOVP156_24 [uncultured Caudovirales phage]
MCDPVSATIATVAVVGGALGANNYNRQAAAARDAAEEQASANRAAEQQRAADERAFQENQANQTRALEQDRINQTQAMYDQQRAVAEAEAARVREAENRRQANIAEGNSAINEVFGQFNNDFYNNRAKNYVDYATPQLDQQYKTTMQGLVRSLARGGNLNSSVRGSAMSDVQSQYDKGMLSIQDQANQYSTQARNAIEAARGNLVAQNAQLADPGTIRSLASSQAQGFSTAPSYTPLQTLISALTKGTGDTQNAYTKTQKPAGVDLYNSAPATETGNVV